MTSRLYCLSLVSLLAVLHSGCSRRSNGEGNSEEKKEVASAPTLPSPAESPASNVSSTGPIQHISGSALLEKIATSKAKGTIVNAWASWCGPCRREFPMLVALKESLYSQGIDVIFVSVDEEDGEIDALNFAKERGLTPPILVAERPLGPFKSALNPKWPGMLPATFLYDSKGKLRYFWGGPVYENELLPVVEGFLEGKDIDGEANFGLSPGKDFRHQ